MGLVVRINDRRHSLQTLPHVKYGSTFNRHRQICSSRSPAGWFVCTNPALRWGRWRRGRKQQYDGRLEKSGSQGQYRNSGSWALTQPNNEDTLEVWVKYNKQLITLSHSVGRMSLNPSNFKGLPSKPRYQMQPSTHDAQLPKFPVTGFSPSQLTVHTSESIFPYC